MTYNINITPYINNIYRFKVVLLGIDNELKDKFYDLNSAILDDKINAQTSFYAKDLSLFSNNRDNKIHFIIFNPKLIKDYFYGHNLSGSKAGIIFFDSRDTHSKVKDLIYEFLKFTRDNNTIPIIFTIDINPKEYPSFDISNNEFCSHVNILNLKSSDFMDFETVDDCDRLFELLASNLIQNNHFEADVDLPGFEFLQKTRNLSLKGVVIKEDEPIDLEFLNQCKNLENLDLSGVKIDVSQLEHIKELNLTSLQLRGARLINKNDFNLDFLVNNDSLEILDLSGLLLTKLNLESLSTCSNLKKLILCSNELTEIDLTQIENLKNLETIDLCFNNLERSHFILPDSLKGIKEVKISFKEDFLNSENVKTKCFCKWCN